MVADAALDCLEAGPIRPRKLRLFVASITWFSPTTPPPRPLAQAAIRLGHHCARLGENLDISASMAALYMSFVAQVTMNFTLLGTRWPLSIFAAHRPCPQGGRSCSCRGKSGPPACPRTQSPGAHCLHTAGTERLGTKSSAPVAQHLLVALVGADGHPGHVLGAHAAVLAGSWASGANRPTLAPHSTAMLGYAQPGVHAHLIHGAAAETQASGKVPPLAVRSPRTRSIDVLAHDPLGQVPVYLNLDCRGHAYPTSRRVPGRRPSPCSLRRWRSSPQRRRSWCGCR